MSDAGTSTGLCRSTPPSTPAMPRMGLTRRLRKCAPHSATLGVCWRRMVLTTRHPPSPPHPPLLPPLSSLTPALHPPADGGNGVRGTHAGRQ